MSRRRDLQSGDLVMFRRWFRLAGPQSERMTDEHITLEINHGGYFEMLADGSKRYKVERTNLSGGVCWVDGIDPDLFSWVDMCNLAYELGYRETPIAFHLKLPRTTSNEGWVYFQSDGDAMEMINIWSKNKKPSIPVYITGGGLRRVQEAMNDDLGINPPDPVGWTNPLLVMSSDFKKAEIDANLASIRLHGRRLKTHWNGRNKKASDRVDHDVMEGNNVDEGVVEGNRVDHAVLEGNMVGDGGVAANNTRVNNFGGSEVEVEDQHVEEELQPLWTDGPLSNLSQFIDEIGTQTGVNEGHESNLHAQEGEISEARGGLPHVTYTGRKKKAANRKKAVIVSEEDEEEWLRSIAPPTSLLTETLTQTSTQKSTPQDLFGDAEAVVGETQNSRVVEEDRDIEIIQVSDLETEQHQAGKAAGASQYTQSSGLSQEERHLFEEAIVEEGRAAEATRVEDWLQRVSVEEVEKEAEGSASGSRVVKQKASQKRPSYLKKSSLGRREKEPVKERPYNTRHQGKKHFRPDPEDENNDSDDSFFLDEDYNLNDGADDEEFRENVVPGENVEEAAEMGYGGQISDDDYDSDDLSSIEGSEAELDDDGNVMTKEKRRAKKIKSWNRIRDLVNPQFALGMYFPDHKTFREAVREYNIRSRRGVYFQKNQWKKMEIKCQPGCDFYIGAALQPNSGTTIQVRTFRSEHNCQLQTRSPYFDYNRVAAEIREQLLADPGWSISGIQEAIQKKYNLDIPTYTIQNGRNKARRMNEGHYLEQYNLLYAYRNELKKRNPGTTCEIECSHEDGIATFKRIYICFGALKEGWRRGCRRIIGLDGTHLKGQHTGQLLAAVGIDGNNGMYPIAYAIAEIESTQTWTWFLEFLKADLDIDDSHAYAFISDKQKGLANAIRRFFPDSEHRHCVRHLYNNFKLAGNTGEGLKQTFWNAARVARPEWYNKLMIDMQQQSQKAWEWFNDPNHEDRNPIHWSRSHFRFAAECDILINNICEVFNASIIRARSKPILTMLEMIRMDLMQRMANRRVAVTKWKYDCGPRVVKQIRRTTELTNQWKATMAGEYNYQVQGGINNTMHIVDLRNRTCDCRKWSLSGIPCEHAICALRSRSWEATVFVNDSLKKEAYAMAYAPMIMPISDKTLWEPINAPLRPPPKKRQTGRPSTKRRPSAGENLAPPTSTEPRAPRPQRTTTASVGKPNPNDLTRLSRKGMIMSCRTCGQQGHNSAGCPQKRKPNNDGSSASTNKRKRPPKPTKVSNKATKNAQDIVVKSRGTARKAKLLAAGKAANVDQGACPSNDRACRSNIGSGPTDD